MSSGKMVVFDGEHSSVYFGAAVAGFQGALEISLTAVEGTSDMAWFDKLHRAAVKATKNAVGEQIPLKVEVGAIRFSFELVDAAFAQIRNRILER